MLGTGAKHGYGIAMRLHQLSDDVLRVEEGSLYPALYRMEEQRLIDSEWGATENNRKAKFYKLTRKGRAAADAELRRLVAAVEGRHARAARHRTRSLTCRSARPATTFPPPPDRALHVERPRSRHGTRDDVPHRLDRPRSTCAPA